MDSNHGGDAPPYPGGVPTAAPTKVPTAPTAPNPVAAAASASRSTAKSDNSRDAAYEKRWLENFNLLKPCIRDDGTIDYASLDEEMQKRMKNFVKDQRSAYRRRESNPDEPNPMTQQRLGLLQSAKFNFKPQETLKAKSEEKKQAKAIAKEQRAANQAKKGSSLGESGTPGMTKSASSGEMTPVVKTKPRIKIKKATPSGDTNDASLDRKMPAKKMDGSDDDSDDSSDDDSSKPSSMASSSMKTPAKKSPKPKSSTGSPATSRKRNGKPTYLEMVHEAIVTMKDRTGSSGTAISKWIAANHEFTKSTLDSNPNMFKSRMNQAIKLGIKDGRFMKIKGSYKISPEWTKKQKEASRAAEARDRRAKQKIAQMTDAERIEAEEERRRKKREADMTPEELEEERQRKQMREAARAKKLWIEQQIKKRRFPIEDTKLHRDDKEWGVKPPSRVIKRPALPHTLTCLVPPHLRSNAPKKYHGPVANASSAGNGDWRGGGVDRGLITDAIHVYHFFCGDVGLIDDEHPVPKFSFKTLLYALDEVLNGNAKEAKSLPPLLTHLLVTTLRMLTSPQHAKKNDAELLPVDLRLQDDLVKLGEGLNAVSWSQVCFFYIDMMERYYTSDESLEEGVLAGVDELDMSYYWDTNKTESELIETKKATNDDGNGSNNVPHKRYKAYVGDLEGVLYKAIAKLQQQKEPWTLKAEELMALLRALTDDVLANRPGLAADIFGRSAKLNELAKAKRLAVIKYNKVKLDYEGPKKPLIKPKKPDGNEETGENNDEVQADAEPNDESDKPFKPTATKQQFITAEKAWFKAAEAYDAGITKLIARTEPIGFDRNFNAFYVFPHDPEMMHVEQLKQSLVPPEIKNIGAEFTPFSSWHFIDTKSLFDQFMESLDVRGVREKETFEVCTHHITAFRRRLQDDKRENNRSAMRVREKEELERRLENAQSACDAEDGRRSGRLAGIAVEELKKVQEEIEAMTKAHEAEERAEKMGREKASDYSSLTGLQLLADFFTAQRTTRRNLAALNSAGNKSDKEGKSESELLANVSSLKLWLDDRIGGNGTLHILAEALIALEKKCNDLAPAERHDITCEAWRKQLSDASCAWAIDCVMQLGPSADDEKSNGCDESETPSKKQKVEQTSGSSYANLVTTVKNCLKDLEIRIFAISGKKRSLDEADLTAEDNDASSREDGDDTELTKRRNSWKIKINALKRIPTLRYGLIRDVIAAAITNARKSHLNQVAAELKSALQLLRPYAAGEAKAAAIKVLEKYGGYDGLDDEEDDFEELATANETDPDDRADAVVASLLCDEFRMINGSLGGDDFADTTDWSEAIKECKSVSRLALMVQTFVSKAEKVLDNLIEERNNLDGILGVNAKRTSRTKSSIPRNHDSSTPIWCNAKLTDKLVKARVNGFPWWPAHVITPLDTVVADALKGSGYAIVSSVGNEAMFLVSDKDIVDFIEEIDEDLSKYDKATLEDLHDAITIGKKLWRQQNRGVASPWSAKKSRPRLSEEKKSD